MWQEMFEVILGIVEMDLGAQPEMLWNFTPLCPNYNANKKYKDNINWF